MFSGVRAFGGGVCLVSKECFEVVDLDPWRDSCPRDILWNSASARPLSVVVLSTDHGLESGLGLAKGRAPGNSSRQARSYV